MGKITKGEFSSGLKAEIASMRPDIPMEKEEEPIVD